MLENWRNRMIKFRAWNNDCKVIREYDELKGLTLDALDASYFKLEQFTEADIEHYGLQDFKKEEVTDDEQ